MHWLILVCSLLLGLVILEISRPVSYVDRMDIKCGPKLKEVCPWTGQNWR